MISFCFKIDDFKANTTNNIFLIVATIFLVLLNIAFIMYYAKFDHDMKQLNKELKDNNIALSTTASSVCGIFKNTSESLNTFSHSLKDEKKLDLNLWSFDKSTQYICDAVYKIVSQISGNKALSVTYTKLEDESNKKIKTVGYYNETLIKPNIVNKVRSFNEDFMYYDAKIFNENNPKIVAFENKDEIDLHFQYKDKINRTEIYNQYIAVPVVCNDKKIIGVIQVCAIGDTKIAHTKNELIEIAKKHIIQFAFLSLLFYKNEKSFLSIPSIEINNRRID